MADILTDEERALIDAAVAAGRVTVVPQGVSGAPAYGQNVSWKVTFYPNQKGQKEWSKALDERVFAMRSSGAEYKAIAKACNISIEAARWRYNKMKAKGAVL